MNPKFSSADLQVTGVVSLWLGNFDSEQEFDEYMNLSKQFEMDFGLDMDRDRDDRGEYAVPGEEQDIPGLLAGFFLSSKFAEAATQAANAQGWTTAKAALVQHHFKYDPDLIGCDSDAPMTFIGSFSYAD